MKFLLAGIALFVVAEVLALALPHSFSGTVGFLVGLPSGSLMVIGVMEIRENRRERRLYEEATR